MIKRIFNIIVIFVCLAVLFFHLIKYAQDNIDAFLIFFDFVIFFGFIISLLTSFRYLLCANKKGLQTIISLILTFFSMVAVLAIAFNSHIFSYGSLLYKLHAMSKPAIDICMWVVPILWIIYACAKRFEKNKH